MILFTNEKALSAKKTAKEIINMSKSGRYASNRIKIREITASETCTVADCGTLFMINPTADTVLTLPAATSAGKGWWIQVMFDEGDGSAIANNVSIAIDDGTFFTGVLIAGDGGGASVANGTSNDHITCKDDVAKSGEWFRIVCLGDRYVAHGLIEDASNTLFADAASNA